MTKLRNELEFWAKSISVPFVPNYRLRRRKRRSSAPLRSLGDLYRFPSSPCVDYGRFIQRTPLGVLKPRSVKELSACVAWLSSRGLPITVRGGGHSSGGQTLSDGGVVIDLSGLRYIGKLDTERGTLEVGGGARWGEIFHHTLKRGLQPPVLPDNPGLTVAGTLSVGGFGYTSHVFGPLINNVRELLIVTIDGKAHRVGQDSALFQYSLGGRGQLGIIASAVIGLRRLSPSIVGRWSTWRRAEDLVEAVLRLPPRYNFIRAACILEASPRTEAFIGGFSSPSLGAAELAFPGVGPVTQYGRITHPVSRIFLPPDIERTRPYATPAMEFTLPLRDGFETWERVSRVLQRSGLRDLLPNRGPRVVPVVDTQRFPLSPVPRCRIGLMVALRPQIPLARVGEFLKILRGIGETVVDAGGRIYLMSMEVGPPGFHRSQFGREYDALLLLKRKFDPKFLLNPGFFPNENQMCR